MTLHNCVLVTLFSKSKLLGVRLHRRARACSCQGKKSTSITMDYGLYSPSECEKLIAVAESAGFGFTCYPKDYRGNLRLVTNDRTGRAHLEKIKKHGSGNPAVRWRDMGSCGAESALAPIKVLLW